MKGAGAPGGSTEVNLELRAPWFRLLPALLPAPGWALPWSPGSLARIEIFSQPITYKIKRQHR